MLRTWVLIVLCSTLMGLSCVGYERLNTLMQRSRSLEKENQQEELLSVYREILQIAPENREIREKLFRLQEELARSFNDQVRRALKEGRLQSALSILERHCSLLPENPPSPQIERELQELLIGLESLKYQAQLAQQDGDYIRVRDLLAQVIKANHQDTDAHSRLDRVVREGKRKYLDDAHSSEREGDWRSAWRAYEMALDLRPDPQTRERLEISRNALDALSECKSAVELLDGDKPEEALDHMKKAETYFPLGKIPFCSVVQQRINTAMALIHYQRGVRHEGKEEWERAFEEFIKVESLKPDDPSALEHLEKVRKKLGKKLYSQILYHLEQRQLWDAYRISMRLELVLPDSGEALDLAAEAMARWADGLYRHGIYCASHRFHANAWLHFSSIAEHIPDYLDVRRQASEQWQKVQERVRTRMTFFPFFSRVSGPGLMKEWNANLFESLEKHAPEFWKIVASKEDVPPSDLEEFLNLIKSITGGTAACGWLEHLNVQRSVSTSFEPMEYTVKEKVLNPRYFQLQSELRLLYSQFQSVLLADGPTSSSATEIKQNIDQLEEKLAGMSPVMEVSRTRKASKKIQTHKLVGNASMAFKVFDVRTMKEVWSKDVKEEETVSGEAVDPIFEAGFPGKSLDLPSEGEIKRRLLDKMIPWLQKETDAYLRQYRLSIFQQAEDLVSKGQHEEALELYADFLAMEPEEDSDQFQRARDMLERAREAIGRMKPLESIGPFSSGKG